MAIVAVVADANVLLSAVVGKAASRIFSEHSIAVHVTEFNSAEVEEYIPAMAAKYGLPEELVLLSWKLLPLRAHPFEDYYKQMARALRDIGSRDPEDAHALALARTLKLPLWSNDRDFTLPGLKRFATAELLKALMGVEAGFSPCLSGGGVR